MSFGTTPMTIDFKKYIPRFCEAELRDEAERYPILSVVGPRQSGKTRMIKEIFPQFPYLDMENKDLQDAANRDIIWAQHKM
jgi:predicted AAA+ superfamily ATPase